MRDLSFFEDRLSPRRSLPAQDRAWLRSLPAEGLAAFWAETLIVLGLGDEDGRWRIETGRDEKGWLPAERVRFKAWLATGHSVSDARTALRWGFVSYLVRGGRLGVGDEVMTRG